MIRIREIKLTLNNDNYDNLKNRLLKKLNISELIDFKILKRSIDARNKSNILIVYEVVVSVKNEEKILNNNVDKNIMYYEEPVFQIERKDSIKINRPVVVGSGPAGLFCALLLAENGLKPLIIERGKKIEERVEDVQKFWDTNILNTESNVQFGEGGAGTFSDGKLNTLIKSSVFQNKVFETFVECGANENILYDSKPHIGTDVLRKIIINLRNKIINYGGEFRYSTKLTDIVIDGDCVKKVIVNDGEEIDTDIVILAIGHSARDTFVMLHNYLDMCNKPFALGIRIQHKQSMINKSQYGFEDNRLGAAPYKLTYKCSDGSGVYSFCMCPGGFVVNASSEKNRLAINGMSNYLRDEENANSAIVITVNEKDYGTNLFDGMKFQQRLEEKAYELGNGNIPISLYKDYKNNTISDSLGSVKGIFKGNYTFANINEIFPEKINNNIKEAIEYFNKIINGFNSDDAVIAAIESRTSSPIRINRDEYFMANVKGVYPCGEGAGYAGGITSAAVDGLKIGKEIIENYILK